ncbi:MAG: hypothetical protein IT228_08035 [Flavobacteriales bacterium]|nr:hypothetical protein [Flavobacteriales bacterium]MCC6577276.1 hypothetical protein [Flavobacteriales bacterium]
MLRHYILIIAALCATRSVAQKVHIKPSPDAAHVTLMDLEQETTQVSGQGNEVPGIDLDKKGDPRHWIGGDSTMAARIFEDRTWSRLNRSEDSVVTGATVHWVRYHLRADAVLRDLPLVVNVRSRCAFVLYLNGQELARSNAPAQAGSALATGDSIPHMSVPISLLGDGDREVIALRITTPPSSALEEAGLRVTLHRADNMYRIQRTMLHYGVFIGINIIILLFALVMWADDRRQLSWLVLASLSLITAIDTLCHLGGDQRNLGFPLGLAEALDRFSTVMLVWPTYLLIIVLRMMRGDLTVRMARRYTTGVLTMTTIGTVATVLDAMGLFDTLDSLTFDGSSIAFVVSMLIMGLAFGVIITWFTIEVIRLGFRLLRAKGYERWVGAGAVASLLLTLMLNIIGAFTGVGLSGWLSVIADYCNWVAVPLSVAVYMAIRSAHHNRLVARQRDELDAEVKERTSELRAEKERSDALLLNILPFEVAEELKAKGAADARHFEQATVLFTDFRGFTQLSEQVGPDELVQELNTCFKTFDAIMGHYRIEKIKTIGDAYMAAGGLPDPQHGSPADVVRAALEMQDFMKQHKAEREAQGKPFFEMRVGIHTGPVVAGIVGVKKFQYDIWGDTVNTASRMESSGEVGQVNISEATYRLVKDAEKVSSSWRMANGDDDAGHSPTPIHHSPSPAFKFTPRGKVQAKGKGEMEMYFVERC